MILSHTSTEEAFEALIQLLKKAILVRRSDQSLKDLINTIRKDHNNERF